MTTYEESVDGELAEGEEHRDEAALHSLQTVLRRQYNMAYTMVQQTVTVTIVYAMFLTPADCMYR